MDGVRALTAPVLFVGGKYDDLCSESELKRLCQAASAAPLTKTVVLDEANHRFVGVEGEVARIIGGYLQAA